MGSVLVGSHFSLAEVRVLFELALREGLTAADLRRDLDMDQGYLSRILRRFERRRIVTRERSKDDARRSIVALTERGRRELAPIDNAADAQVRSLLEERSVGQQDRLVDAMLAIEEILARRPAQG